MTGFPLANPAVKCGLRTDLPKKQRVHQWAYLGLDSRHTGDGLFADMHIYACVRCGIDKQTSKLRGGG